jgi:hypothetical protein
MICSPRAGSAGAGGWQLTAPWRHLGTWRASLQSRVRPAVVALTPGALEAWHPALAGARPGLQQAEEEQQALGPGPQQHPRGLGDLWLLTAKGTAAWGGEVTGRPVSLRDKLNTTHWIHNTVQ